MSEKLVLNKEDFNLVPEYNLFDIIYSCPAQLEETKIKTWVVVGNVLNGSSDKRCFQAYLCSYPISIYVSQNTYITFNELSYKEKVFRSGKEAIEYKTTQLTEFYEKRLQSIKIYEKESN